MEVIVSQRDGVWIISAGSVSGSFNTLAACSDKAVILPSEMGNFNTLDGVMIRGINASVGHAILTSGDPYSCLVAGV